MRTDSGGRPETASAAVVSAALGAGSRLTARGLVKAFGGNLAVDGVALEVRSGTLVSLIGPNGAGKSTVGNLICGTLKPDAGQILLGRDRIDHLPAHRRARLGLARTFQLSSEFQRLTVLENLLVAGSLRQHAAWWRAMVGRARWKVVEAEQVAAARRLLADFELSGHERRYGGELSGGQRRLVEIARALMGSPAVLVLDEPMAGLSPHMVTRVGEHLRRLRDSGLALLLVEHNVGVVSALSDWIVVMSQGAIIAEGRGEDVLGNEEVQAVYVAG